MISKYYKAVTAFVTSFGGFLVLILANPTINAALTSDVKGWLVTVGVPAVVGFGTWLTRNENTVSEAEDLAARARSRVATGKQPA